MCVCVGGGGQQVIDEARGMWQELGLFSFGQNEEDICHMIKQQQFTDAIMRVKVYGFIRQFCGDFGSS